MLVFTLAISCLTIPNFPWFVDLTFQVPIQHCSLQHRNLAEHHFCFGPATSILTGAVSNCLCSSPIAYWTPSDLRGSGVISFCLFRLYMAFFRQEYWSELPFQSPVAPVLSELFAMTHPSWGALHGMAHSPFMMTKLWSMKGWFLIPFYDKTN